MRLCHDFRVYKTEDNALVEVYTLWVYSLVLVLFDKIPLYLPANEPVRHFESFYRAMYFSAKRGLAIACRPSVRLSVCSSLTLVICDHIGWKSWKLIVYTGN